MNYQLKMRDETGSNESETIVAETLAEARELASDRVTEWVNEGAWGDDGAAVTVWWTLIDDNGDEVWEDSATVDVEPNHRELIRAVGGDHDCDHEWTSEGEGGLDENPGVWSVGGTAMVFASHCTRCGLHKRERTTGSQRNPGESDTVTYEMPDNDSAGL